jgi:predicted short-subunit dehydrogenase-like oxidoreductase (DUF2520 family)
MATEEEESMDLSASIGQAVEAARRGDIDALEAELAKLRRLNADSVGEMGTRLRAMARSVQDHPSYKASPAARTG